MTQELVNYQQGYSMLPTGTTDEMLIGMWLRNAAESTKDAYRADLKQFFEFVKVSIQQINLLHLQNYQDELESSGLERSTIARKLKSVKSLLSFAKKTGYTTINVGVMIELPKEKEELAERLLTEDQILKMIHLEEQHSEREKSTQYDRRNYVLIRTMYATGARISEICNLKWKDIQPRGETGQVTLYGKGDKTRHVILKPETYRVLSEYRHDASDEEYVFKSRGGRHKGHAGLKLNESHVYRIVEESAVRAKIATYTEEKIVKGELKKITRSRVSPHWLRHAHATHALDNGATIALVKETLGHKSVDTTLRYTHVHPDKSSVQHLKV